MSEEGRFTFTLEQQDDYQFLVRFDLPKSEPLLLDEPPPLGQRAGPNASRLLAAAAANCLSASLMYCLARDEVPARNVITEVTCIIVRNERKRLRVGKLEVRLRLQGELLEAKRLPRCLNLFEDFCVVTDSIRDGIPVAVSVSDEHGELLYERDADASTSS